VLTGADAEGVYDRVTQRAFLYLVCSLFDQHPLLRARARNVVSDVFTHVGGGDLDALTQLDARRSALDALVHMAAVQPVAAVLDGARLLAQSDRALVRYFARAVLERASPPYSPPFRTAVTALLGTGGLAAWKAADEELRASVLAFCTEALESDLSESDRKTVLEVRNVVANSG
jgi:hypothetical protein